MKLMNIIILATVILSFSCNDAISDDTSMNTTMDSLAYAIGVQMGMNFENDELSLNTTLLKAGIDDYLAGNSKLSDVELQEVFAEFQKVMNEKRVQIQNDKASVNLEKGEKFLAENKKRKEVTETASGLQYEVLKKGDGPKPQESSTVKVHYHGTLIDGTVFDSSVQRGEPIDFPLNGVIPGWTEGVQLMNVGSKFKFFIPSKLAYGAQGAGASIGPNETLIFEVELIEIIK